MQLNKQGAKLTKEEADKFFAMIRAEELYGLKRRLRLNMAVIEGESRCQQTAERIGVPLEEDPHATVVLDEELEDLAGASVVFWEEYADSEVVHLGGWPQWSNVGTEEEQVWENTGRWTA